MTDREAENFVSRLSRIIRALGEVRTPEDVAEVMVSAVTPEFGVSTAGVWLPQGDRLRVAAARWSVENDRQRFSEIPLASDLPGARVFRTGEALWVESAQESLREFPVMGVARGFFVLPLNGSKGRMGIVGATVHDLGALSVQEREYITTITDLCGQAIERTASAVSERQIRNVLEFLAEATRTMVAKLDPADILEILVRLACTYLAPWCAVYVAEGNVLTRASIAISGAELLKEEVLQSDPVPVGTDTPLAQAFQSGMAQVVPQVPVEVVTRMYPPSLARRIVGTKPWSALVVPIVTRDEVTGVLSLVSDQWDGAPPDPIRFAAEGLATRSGMVLDAAKRYQSQRDLVEMFTSALLPEALPTIHRLDLAASYLPALGRVCGDWYDVVSLDNGDVLLGLGDAMGHGIEASTRMAKLRFSARAVAAIDPRPAAVLGALWRVAEEDGSIATALYIRIDPASGAFSWASAGHLAPFLVRNTGEVRELQGHSIVLGAGKASYVDLEGHLEPEDAIVVVSDGVVERRRLGLDRGVEGLRRTLVTNHGAAAEAIVQEVLDRHCGDPEDDCCVLALRWQGVTTAS